MNYKNIICTASGFGLGLLTGYQFCKRKFEERYRADVEENRKFYLEKLEELGVMEEGFDPEDLNCEDSEDAEEDADEAEEAELIAPLKTYRQDGKPLINYAKPSLDEVKRRMGVGNAKEMWEHVSAVTGVEPEHLGDIDEDTSEEHIAEDDPEYEAELDQMAEDYARRRSENMKRGDPYLIEPEEYTEGPEDYDRQALYYYSQDRVLCEDDDKKVEDEEECIGFDYEDKLDMQTTCWVRNDRLRVLYEIHRIDDSYKKAVMNVRETPREREFRIQGRRKQALDER